MRRGTQALLVAAVALLVAMLAGPWLAPHDPLAVNLGDALAPASWSHLAGTDQLGRDVFSRVLTGGRTTVGIALAALLASIAVGVPVGLYAGYLGGRLDWGLMRVSDAFMSFPEYVVAIVLTGLMGPGFGNLVIAVMAVKWVAYTRLVRSVVIQEKTQDYYLVARVSGSSTTRTVHKHLLPHVVGPVLSLATLDIGKIVLLVASLSFLGLGVPQPSPEWGAMLNEGRTYFTQTSLLMLAPGLAIFLVVVLTSVAGDQLSTRYSIDPRLSESRA
ncbi:nickel transporter permease [Piscicoccus intestinalis]|uniref:nickel transporter permease n=1 Tax=Piscicoccus intestinalis TaxID=746033 RepID=UPI0008391209|nr:nickel transporter permease [Piscicoccus intestinalis]